MVAVLCAGIVSRNSHESKLSSVPTYFVSLAIESNQLGAELKDIEENGITKLQERTKTTFTQPKLDSFRSYELKRTRGCGEKNKRK